MNGSTRPDGEATGGIETWGSLVLLERVGGGAYGDVYRARLLRRLGRPAEAEPDEAESRKYLAYADADLVMVRQLGR